MNASEWYWDLRHGRAVPAEERGPGEHMLGPYPTRVAAENWKQTVDERNESWDEDDAEWNAWDTDRDDARTDPAQ
ncbi:MAG: hypothetical protein QNJ12_05635 [Ilumatobacter sp.]|uniref:hypothetical protein n=1 Tax=Ilumatobacter sp. TaxID=1967498 RepID=UPI002607A779|nr:hypothetical protein [Ilumatobacter sp.]MDJ0768252.1 hypothetical protein [Ilumatobacter sp.]